MTVADWPLESRVFWHLLRAGITDPAVAAQLPDSARVELTGIDGGWPNHDAWEGALGRLEKLADG